MPSRNPKGLSRPEPRVDMVEAAMSHEAQNRPENAAPSQSKRPLPGGLFPDGRQSGTAPGSVSSVGPAELFCIHSYAGESGPPCGWRGAVAAITRHTAGKPLCPRCGRATLFVIPPAGDVR